MTTETPTKVQTSKSAGNRNGNMTGRGREDLVNAMESGTDDRTQAGVTLSLGLAAGMLLGGAPRLLVLLALAPVAAMALVLGDRRARRTRTLA